MRYFGYTLGDPSTPMPPPSPGQMEEMGAFMEEATKAGVYVAGGGMGSLDEAIQVSLHDGKYTVTDGPFTEAKELIGGWALLECRDRDEALEWTKRFLGVLGEGECRVRPVY
ncbi:MAG TPA: YciI family protein [Streptosporangiaceae bacterium]|nr:YciI family protein [Streptosporangiaceae bacterium]